MFCSRPLGMLPEVTGPYCSQTRSGAAPPEAWLSTVALDWLMEALLFGSQSTVTFLCAASYCAVSVLSPALSAAVIAPVLGGSTALTLDQSASNSSARPAAATAVRAGRDLLLVTLDIARTHLR